MDSMIPLNRGDIYPWGLLYLHEIGRHEVMVWKAFLTEGRSCQMWALANYISVLLAVSALTACGEPAFENAGSQASLLEDREACVMEVNNSAAADAYRQNPDAHPEYPSETFNEMNRCIERRGWKQVRSEQEQEQLRDAIAKEAAQKPPSSVSDSKATESLARAVEQRFSLRHKVKND